MKTVRAKWRKFTTAEEIQFVDLLLWKCEGVREGCREKSSATVGVTAIGRSKFAAVALRDQ